MHPICLVLNVFYRAFHIYPTTSIPTHSDLSMLPSTSLKTTIACPTQQHHQSHMCNPYLISISHQTLEGDNSNITNHWKTRKKMYGWTTFTDWTKGHLEYFVLSSSSLATPFGRLASLTNLFWNLAEKQERYFPWETERFNNVGPFLHSIPFYKTSELFQASAVYMHITHETVLIPNQSIINHLVHSTNHNDELIINDESYIGNRWTKRGAMAFTCWKVVKS